MPGPVEADSDAPGCSWPVGSRLTAKPVVTEGDGRPVAFLPEERGAE